MPAEVEKQIQLEVAHVLCADIVEYSKLMMNEQRALLDLVNQIARGTDEFQSAKAATRLNKIPTVDRHARALRPSNDGDYSGSARSFFELTDGQQISLLLG